MTQRILFVTESLFPLGAAQQLKLLADALVQRGDQVHVAVLGQKIFEPIAWTENGIEVSFLNGDDKTPLNTWRDGFYVASELRKLIHHVAPDIVHAWCGPSEWLLLLATERIPAFQSLPDFRLLSTELYRQPPQPMLRRGLENRFASRIEMRIVPHETVKRDWIENGAADQNFRIVPNAVAGNAETGNTETGNTVARDAKSQGGDGVRGESRAWILAEMNLPPTAKLAGAVAPLSHRTRLKDLIWATDLLTCIREDFHFLIIGTGSQRQQLKRFAALTEARTHVHFLGWPDSPGRVIAGLDFYWHSHLRDPLSGNLLAAMGAGVPAISVFGPGTEEIIRHQETGFAVNFGARDEFARWTKFLIERPDPARKLAQQGQRFVNEHFSPSAMIEGYFDVIGV